MAIAQAKQIVQGLKWHHLGFCFFWAVTFVALIAPGNDLAAASNAFSYGRQLASIVAIAVAAVLSFRRGSRPYPPEWAYFAGIALSAGSLLYYMAFFLAEFSTASVVVAAVLTGGAQGAFFVMWQSFYASEGTSRTTIYIPLSALCSVVLCIVVGMLPMEWLVMFGVIVLPAVGAWTLHKSLSEVVPYDAEPLSRERRGMLLRDMGRPVFCVCAIGLAWKLVSSVAPGEGLGSFESVMLGMSLATLVVTGIELFTERGFDMLRVYQVLFPVITGAFLIPTFLGSAWMGAASTLTMFGFEVVNLLLLITCAAYASRRAMDSSIVYALCVGPTLIALLVGDVMGNLLAASSALDFALVVDVLFVCVYVLAAALFLASVGRNRGEVRREVTAAPVNADDGEEAGIEEPSALQSETALVNLHEEESSVATQLSFDEKLAAAQGVEPLSSREREVAELIARGNTVAAIARRLFISENTVRGHSKSIYRKLGVHSKQELIDLLG